MGVRIVHFGVDERSILATLASCGYGLDVCGLSTSKLNEALQKGEADAVVVEEDGTPLDEHVLPAAYSASQIPFILFQGNSCVYDSSTFDLVIPLQAPPEDWIRRLEGLIEQSRAIRTQTCQALEQSNTILAQTRQALTQLRLAVEKSASSVEESVAHRVASEQTLGEWKACSTELLSVGSVLIVDDYAVWRETIASTLRRCAQIGSLCEAGDGAEAVEKARALKPDLILLDLNLPGMNGIEAARQIRHVAPRAAILFVSMNRDPDIVCEALGTGARGYVLKTHAGKELRSAIDAVLRQQQYISQGLT